MHSEVIRFLIVPTLLFPACILAAELQGRIVSVSDGDTVTLLEVNNTQHKIRLLGIDAPELHQDYGQKSKQALAALIFSKNVVADCVKLDRYNRKVCKISVDGVDANLEQVKGGMAWWYRKYSKEQSPTDRKHYEIAELQAKSERIGLWGDINPTPPWEWRHLKK